MIDTGILLAVAALGMGQLELAEWGTPELVGPGVISTVNTEFNTTLSPGGDVIVVTRYEDATGVGTIESLQLVGENWVKVDYFQGRLDGIDAGMGICHPDGNRFLFYRDADVWQMQRDGSGNWSEPSRVAAPISTGSPEAYPTLSDDGTLCFTRQVRGNWDIYLAESQGEGWGQPERPTTPVNTQYREHDALITPNGKRLIFVRMGEPGGPGMSDLYTCVRTETGWSEPKLLPFNTSAIDGSPCLSPDGKWLYFTSGRPTGTREAAGLCIWRVRTPKDPDESTKD